jgi:hypothetical protein
MLTSPSLSWAGASCTSDQTVDVSGAKTRASPKKKMTKHVVAEKKYRGEGTHLDSDEAPKKPRSVIERPMVEPVETKASEYGDVNLRLPPATWFDPEEYKPISLRFGGRFAQIFFDREAGQYTFPPGVLKFVSRVKLKSLHFSSTTAGRKLSHFLVEPETPFFALIKLLRKIAFKSKDDLRVLGLRGFKLSDSTVIKMLMWLEDSTNELPSNLQRIELTRESQDSVESLKKELQKEELQEQLAKAGVDWVIEKSKSPARLIGSALVAKTKISFEKGTKGVVRRSAPKMAADSELIHFTLVRRYRSEVSPDVLAPRIGA